MTTTLHENQTDMGKARETTGSRNTGSPPIASDLKIEPLPASRKVYQVGQIHTELRVPARKILQSKTVGPDNQTEDKPPFRVYDTSGPYTDVS